MTDRRTLPLTPREVVVFAGGGSGGHLTPALAIAAALPPGIWPHVISCGRQVERDLITRHRTHDPTLRYDVLPHDAGRSGRTPLSRLRNARDAERAAGRLLDAVRPRAVVGVGGYASVPTVLAAAKRRIPITLLEQNAVAGRATELLAPLASQVLAAMPLSRPLPRVGVVGNPIAAGFATVPRADSKTLLVLGGSQGAGGLNALLPQIVRRLPLAGWSVVHQCGAAHIDETQVSYEAMGFGSLVSVRATIDDMPLALAGAGVVVSRAGATTLAELAAVGVPSMLVPSPTSVHDHQRRNAAFAREQGGVDVVEQDDADGLAATLSVLLADRRLRRWRGEQIKRIANPNAASVCVDAILGSASGRRVA